MDENAVEAKDLTRTFGSFCAVDKVTFNVKKGEIFGFLGSNGAGKSTCIRMLCGLLGSTSGSASVVGFDINKDAEQIKKNIGYMSQKFSLYNDLRIKENLTFFGSVYGLSGKELEKRMDWVYDMVNLRGMENSMTGDLPTGWKQRIALGTAVIHNPKMVFLDEPTGGVDPISRRTFWELIHQLSSEGITVLVTTHYLDEAEYCHNIVLMNAGAIAAQGSPRALKEKYMKDINQSDPSKKGIPTLEDVFIYVIEKGR